MRHGRPVRLSCAGRFPLPTSSGLASRGSSGVSHTAAALAMHAVAACLCSVAGCWARLPRVAAPVVPCAAARRPGARAERGRCGGRRPTASRSWAWTRSASTPTAARSRWATRSAAQVRTPAARRAVPCPVCDRLNLDCSVCSSTLRHGRPAVAKAQGVCHAARVARKGVRCPRAQARSFSCWACGVPGTGHELHPAAKCACCRLPGCAV